MSQRPVPADRLPAWGATGLRADQVERQRGFGFNDIVPVEATSWLVVARDTARDPMLWFLVLTAGLFGLFGLLGQVGEALTLLVAIAPLVGMDAYLHRRTTASSAGLASRLASSARVLRDGQWQDIPSRELVPGDLAEVRLGGLELVIHPTAMLAFQDLPAAGPLAPVRRGRRARFFSAGAWWGIGSAGGLVSAAVVWSYPHALGADQDVEHARAMALAMLLVTSAGITTGLTKLHQPAARWLVAGTLASLGVIVQTPVISRLLNLRPLHGSDWALVALAFAVVVVATVALASLLRREPE